MMDVEFPTNQKITLEMGKGHTLYLYIIYIYVVFVSLFKHLGRIDRAIGRYMWERTKVKSKTDAEPVNPMAETLNRICSLICK